MAYGVGVLQPFMDEGKKLLYSTSPPLGNSRRPVLKITQNAQGVHVLKRNFSPAVREKSSVWNTIFSNHTNDQQTINQILSSGFLLAYGKIQL